MSDTSIEERVAQQYRDEGYEVVLRPTGDVVPAFAAGHELDMIAVRGGERVIVEVRPTRADLDDGGRLTQLAERTNSQPGWRFDVVIAGPGSPLSRAVEPATEPSDEQLQAQLVRARLAERAGLTDMAVVHAWAAFEASMRRLRGEAELYGRTTPAQLLSTLYSNGFLARHEFDRAKAAYHFRSRAVHGFATPTPDPALLNDIIALTEKLLGQQVALDAAAAS